MSKTINKAKLDAGIDLVKRYYVDDKMDVLRDMLATTNEAEQLAGLGLHSINELLTSITRPSGLKPDATNEDIYKVLEVLGWSVE